MANQKIVDSLEALQNTIVRKVLAKQGIRVGLETIEDTQDPLPSPQREPKSIRKVYRRTRHRWNQHSVIRKVYRRTRHRWKNYYATIGLVSGISSSVLCFINLIPLSARLNEIIGMMSVISIMFSWIGLKRVKRYGARGKVQSWIGLGLGLYGFVIFLIFLTNFLKSPAT